ncbi:MAG: GrpB family protein [Ruminococcus sp.]|nr:GrpB family protein [Ruminococcus sp.]
MKKKLTEMTLEELWQMFPVSLVPHDERWSDYYDEMKCFLCSILSPHRIERISHIGSTAISGICAKNIIDILIETEADESMEAVAEVIEHSGFIRMSSEMNRVSFNKGYTESGFAEKVFHLHLRFAGDNDELYFRDYLSEHPQTAKQYEQLKLELCRKYEHNRDAYTAAKADFVNKWTAEAKKTYANKYSKF